MKIGHRSKDSTGDDIALYLCEPYLDLIQPGGVGGGKVKLDLGILREELLDGLCFVRREIVEHDMNLSRPLGFSH